MSTGRVPVDVAQLLAARDLAPGAVLPTGATVLRAPVGKWAQLVRQRTTNILSDDKPTRPRSNEVVTSGENGPIDHKACPGVYSRWISKKLSKGHFTDEVITLLRSELSIPAPRPKSDLRESVETQWAQTECGRLYENERHV